MPSLNFAQTSAISPADAILNLELVAYGINAVNTTLNLCDLLSGVLCPLPQYDFVGSATIPLPNSVTDSINIPGIGFIIPDLQATAFGKSNHSEVKIEIREMLNTRELIHPLHSSTTSRGRQL